MESKGKIEEVFMEFGIDESYKAPAIIMDILLNRDKRELLFKKLLETHNYDVSYDWFYEYFQDEHAERKRKSKTSRLFVWLTCFQNYLCPVAVMQDTTMSVVLALAAL